MRKLVFLLFVSVMLLALGGVVNAGSWWVEYGENSGQPGDTRTPAPSNFPQLTQPPWGNPNTASGQGTPSPHLGFSTTSNQCKTCHAVHLADASSYRLLHDISRMTECDWCHDASTGRSSHRPYGEMSLRGKIIRGEHTLRTAVLVPDSSVNTTVWPTSTPTDYGRLPNRSVGDRTVSGNGLYCFDCHTVHGANRVDGWATEIIRQDPAGDGEGSDKTGATSDERKTGFCADCHNLNPNWDANATDDLDVVNPGGRPTGRSHVQGPAADGQMEAYGQVITDSWSSAYWANTTRADRIAAARSGATPEQRFRNPRIGCRGCHSGSESKKSGYNNPGDWSHQTSGSKLLLDDYDGEMGVPTTDPGDPDRSLKELDKICLDCHRDPGTDMIGGTSDDPAGVGLSF